MDVSQARLMDFNMPGGIKFLDKILDGYKAYQTLAAALNLKLFDWIEEKGEATREEIIDALKINGMFARSFLQSLVDLGLLTCSSTEKYANTVLAANFLVNKSEHYQGDWLQLSAGQSDVWGHLSEVLTKEKPGADIFSATPNAQSIKALNQVSLRGELQAVAKAVASWEGFPRAGRILDLSGCHGLYAAALCQLNAKLKGIILENPSAAEYTNEFIHKYGLGEQMQVQIGDISSDEPGTGYDIVLTSHLLYRFRENLSSIFSKVFNCLNPGGLLVSNHWFCSPGCVAVDGLQELDKSLHSFGHPLCHPEDFHALFQTMGFSVVHASEIPSVYGASKLHLAVKGSSSTKIEMISFNCCQPAK